MCYLPFITTSKQERDAIKPDSGNMREERPIQLQKIIDECNIVQNTTGSSISANTCAPSSKFLTNKLKYVVSELAERAVDSEYYIADKVNHGIAEKIHCQNLSNLSHEFRQFNSSLKIFYKHVLYLTTCHNATTKTSITNEQCQKLYVSSCQLSDNSSPRFCNKTENSSNHAKRKLSRKELNVARRVEPTRLMNIAHLSPTSLIKRSKYTRNKNYHMKKNLIKTAHETNKLMLNIKLLVGH